MQQFGDLGRTLEGIPYVPAGPGWFSAPTVLITRFSSAAGATVNACQVDGNGMPVASPATTLFTGGAIEGLALDLVTGDILMTNYNQGNRRNPAA